MGKKSLPPAKPKRGQKLGAAGVIYARYSSHNQKDLSIEQQVAQCMELAREYDISILDTYADRAVSGRTDKRTGFQRMMQHAASGRFRYVLAWKSNRIGRNMLEALINETRLQENGVRILYVEEDFDDTAAGRFAARSMMNVNQFYSENMAEDIRRGLHSNALDCKVTNGHLPLGYTADETLHYAVDEEAAAVVREIFARVAAGDKYVDIFNSLNDRGIRTSYGHPWSRTSLNNLITNERYRGIYIYGDVRIEGGIPRIISDELFFKVREVISMKRKARGRHNPGAAYILTGKLFCGKCGSPMTGVSGTGKSGALHCYYVCRKRRREKACDKAPVRRDEIEERVALAIRDYVLQEDIIEWIADQTVAYAKKREADSQISLLEDQLAEAKKGIRNILDAIQQGIITPSTKSRLQDLEAEQSRLEGTIAAARADIIMVSRDDIISGLSMFRDGDIRDSSYRAQLFDTFLVAVYVYDDELKLVFSFTGDNNTVHIPFTTPPDPSDPPDYKCSSNLPCEPPQCTQTNPAVTFVVINGLFVLSLPIKG